MPRAVRPDLWCYCSDRPTDQIPERLVYYMSILNLIRSPDTRTTAGTGRWREPSLRPLCTSSILAIRSWSFVKAYLPSTTRSYSHQSICSLFLSLKSKDTRTSRSSVSSKLFRSHYFRNCYMRIAIPFIFFTVNTRTRRVRM